MTTVSRLTVAAFLAAAVPLPVFASNPALPPTLTFPAPCAPPADGVPQPPRVCR